MDTSKIIIGTVGGGRYTVTAPIVKEDYGLYLKIEGLELPATYEVDFSNSEHNGTSVTMIGNADGVLIPSQFISSGKDIFAFLYHVGEDYGRTIFKFRIPNKVRPDRTNEQPTPEEQSVIDQAISALNSAVAQTAQDVIDADASAQNASADAERAEEARTDAQNYAEQAEQSAQNASASEQGCARAVLDATSAAAIARARADEASGYAQTASEKADSITGLTATAQTLPSESSATASYNVETGIMSFGIPKGKDGTDGDDGYSPTANVSKSGKTATITITDKTGTTSAQVKDGTDGADGISPTVTITPITGGHRITITDADGEHSADVMDGTGNVDDVQINGQSIVSDGVANVPIASDTTVGVARTDSAFGTGIYQQRIFVTRAQSADIKNGSQSYKPIVPYNQHESAFYALAKASGDTTQSQSSNAVGVYTDEAKAKIQSMLGFGGFELIKTVELTEDSANIEIDTDEAGNAFRLTEMMILISVQPSASTTSNSVAYVRNNRIHNIATINGVVRTTATNISGFIKNLIVPNVTGESCVTEYGFPNATGNFYWNGKFPTGTEKDYSDYLSVYTTGTAKFGTGTVLMLYGRRK